MNIESRNRLSGAATRPTRTFAYRAAFPFVVIGANALAVYIGRTLIPLANIVDVYTAPISAQISAFGPLFLAVAVLTCELLILYWITGGRFFFLRDVADTALQQSE